MTPNSATHTGRALVCAPRLPEFDREGGSRRIFHLIELLQDLGWSVSFLAHAAIDGERYVRTLQERGVATYLGPDSVVANQYLITSPQHLVAAGRFDIAILAFWDMVEYYLPLFRRLSPDTMVIADSVDLHFLRAARKAFAAPENGRLPRGLDREFADRMVREVNAYAGADAVLTVSQKEADLVNDLASPATRAHAVPDLEDLAPSPIPLEERQGVLFIGNFRHPPNSEALAYLCREIVPLIPRRAQARHPVYVVGNALSESMCSLGDGHNVRMVGWVPSILPYLHRARVCVVPLLHGAGTKRKLLQALMVGTPSVSTAVGIEGFDLTDGRHVLVGADPKSFARHVARLLRDDELWTSLASQGRDWAAATHSRSAVRERFRSVLAEIVPPKVPERTEACATVGSAP